LGPEFLFEKDAQFSIRAKRINPVRGPIAALLLEKEGTGAFIENRHFSPGESPR
jgi:hypothetical protein